MRRIKKWVFGRIVVFQIFSNFLGFSVKGHEEEVFNLMNSICERRNNKKRQRGSCSTKI